MPCSNVLNLCVVRSNSATPSVQSRYTFPFLFPVIRSTVLLNNGNYMVACGDGHSLMEVNLDKGEVIRRIGEKDIEGVSLFFVAQLLPTSNNGLYICNWQGHDPSAKESNNPQLMEIDGNNKVIWSLNDNDTFGMISSVCPID